MQICKYSMRGRVKSQTRPHFIRTLDEVRFQISNSQRGKIPFGSAPLIVINYTHI